MLSAQHVADAFVTQYYHILRVSPESVHKFYKESSTLGRPGSDGMMSISTTMKEINDAVISSAYKACDPITEAVHAQDSIMGSVIVGVIGTLTDKESINRKFAQTFYLAPQECGGFYVHNDFLYFLDVDEPTASLSGPQFPEVLAAPKSPSALSAKNSEVADVPNDEQETISVPDPTPKEAFESLPDPTPKEAFESLKKLDTPASPKKRSELLVKKSAGNIEEDSFKKVSYASVLAREAPLSTPAQVSSPPTSGLIKAGPPAPGKAASTPLSSALGINDGLVAEAPVGIHIKDLPSGITQDALLEQVRKFGAVRPNSIHIREYPEDGYRFAFVEFESAKSARSAVEAGEIWIGGWKYEVQYKRSSNQGGSNQGRSMHGRGGHRSDNPGSRDWEGRGGRDGEARGPSWRSSTQDQVRGGSSTATKRNTVRV
ncbi:nuclear transport factor 2 [Daucus carota subsp. sativus]